MKQIPTQNKTDFSVRSNVEVKDQKGEMKSVDPEDEFIPTDATGKPVRSRYLKPPEPPILPPQGLNIPEIVTAVDAKRKIYFSDHSTIKPLKYTEDEILVMRYLCETSPFYSAAHVGLSNYAVSLDARVKNVTTKITTKGSETRGRQRFCLTDDTGKVVKPTANQLMARAFLGPPPTLAHDSVDHMDIDEANDYFYNLRWATKQQQAFNRKKCEKPRHGKVVLQLDPNTLEILKVWPSMVEAGKAMNFTSGNCIWKSIKRGRLSAGYRWAFDNRPLIDADGTVEQWLPVQPEIYDNIWASTRGRIWSVRSGAWFGHRTVDGRRVVAVRLKSGKLKQERVHRLVALAFIGLQPPDKETVDHIDGDCGNNRPENLRYLSTGDNTRHSVAIGTSKTNMNEQFRKPVVQLTMDDKFIKEFISVSEAQSQTRIFRIGDVSLKKRGHAGNYHWQFSVDYFK